MSYKKKLFNGGYLFLQSVYYGLKMDSICRKIRSRYKFEYDLNAILSDLIYTRILEPSSKQSSFQAAKQFLEAPTYELHDVYRALSVLAKELDFIQAEVYKNSFFLGARNDRILYYDCSNYYFEIEQADGDKKYGKSKVRQGQPMFPEKTALRLTSSHAFLHSCISGCCSVPSKIHILPTNCSGY